jgi:hypothetical protein
MRSSLVGLKVESEGARSTIRRFAPKRENLSLLFLDVLEWLPLPRDDLYQTLRVINDIIDATFEVYLLRG